MVGQLWSVLDLFELILLLTIKTYIRFPFPRRLDEISEIGRGAIN